MSVNHILNALHSSYFNLNTILESQRLQYNTCDKQYDVACVLNNAITHIYDIIDPPLLQFKTPTYTIEKGSIWASLKMGDNMTYRCMLFLKKKEPADDDDTCDRLDMVVPIKADMFGWLYRAKGNIVAIKEDRLNKIIDMLNNIETQKMDVCEWGAYYETTDDVEAATPLLNTTREQLNPLEDDPDL